MLQHVPALLTLLFIITTLLAVWLILRACMYNKTFLVILITWLTVQGILGYTGFYTHTHGLPPRIALMPLPPVIAIIILFSTASGRRWMDRFDTVKTTWVHVVRVPVELSLFWLFTLTYIPQTMTFEGSNFDIFSGISAPFIATALRRKSIKKSWAIAWNFLCLSLLFNVVLRGILSAPSPLQQSAFDQPNMAVLYFPFVWLPSVVVPIVLLAHLISLKKLFKSDADNAKQDITQKQ